MTDKFEVTNHGKLTCVCGCELVSSEIKSVTFFQDEYMRVITVIALCSSCGSLTEHSKTKTYV